MTVTLDNVSSNNLTISYLNNVMKDWSTNKLSNKHLHVRCCAHIVNLIVCNGLKEINVSVLRFEMQLGLWDLHLLGNLHLKNIQKRCIWSVRSHCVWMLQLDRIQLILTAEKFEKVFVKLGESEPRYMSYFLDVDSKENKKKHRAT